MWAAVGESADAGDLYSDALVNHWQIRFVLRNVTKRCQLNRSDWSGWVSNSFIC